MLYNITRTYHSISQINKLTRILSSIRERPILLDQILVYLSLSCISGVIILDFANLCSQFLNLPIKSKKKLVEKKKLSFRNHLQLIYSTFREHMLSFIWNFFLLKLWERISGKYYDLMKENYISSFLFCTNLANKKRNCNPCISSTLLTMRKQKSLYFNLYKRGIIA